LIVFGGIVCGLVYVARSAAIPHSPAIVVSFLLLLAPLWFFGFGLDEVLRATLDSPLLRIGVSAGFVVPYLVFAIPAGAFDWKMFVGMWVLAAVPSALLESCRPNPRLVWQDAVVLLVLVATHLLRLLEPAWPAQFAAVPKLFLIDVVAYLYLIVRPIEGVGYSLVPSLSALRIGLREWLFFLPFGIGLGTVLHFTHFQARWPTVGSVGLAVVATFLFVAIPEELFFRGIVQNLLETRIGRVGALIVAAVLFGFSHYHRGGSFDWRYILLAAIAGIFYGRAWRARHQLLAAILTHTAIDVVWSMWFR
jgi:membrane protease YdiL (CAAX protease family)